MEGINSSVKGLIDASQLTSQTVYYTTKLPEQREMHRLQRDATIFCAFKKIQERHKGQFANGRRLYQKKICSASGK
jgi:hypothetical protein